MKFKISSSTISTALGDQTVVLNIKSGKYYELNSSSSFIWMKIKEGLSKNSIIGSIESEFGISAKDASESLEKFILLSESYGFLE